MLGAIARYLPLPFLSEAVKSNNRLMRYAEESLGRHFKQVKIEGESSKSSLFTKLYNAVDEGLTFNEMRDDAMAYIVAGSDTTSNSLTYLIWLVITHPEVKSRLLEELETLPNNFGDKELKELPYLDQVIQETLRLYPAVPVGLPRLVPREGADFSGHWIPVSPRHSVSKQEYSFRRSWKSNFLKTCSHIRHQNSCLEWK